MKNYKATYIITLFFMLMTSFASHAMNPVENEDVCRQYAIEDQIPQEEMSDYMTACLQSVADELAAAESSEENKVIVTD